MTYWIGLAAIVIAVGLNLGDASVFLNLHSFYLVVGGTLVAILLLTPALAMRDLWSLMKQVIVDAKRISPQSLTSLIKNPKAPFSDSYGLVAQANDLWELGTVPIEFERLLIHRAEGILARNSAAIACLRNLGKYPPALGMIGTVMGMIKLFGNLGISHGQGQIGVQLALAMTATLYGLVLSNGVVLPLVDRLEANEQERKVNIEATLRILFAQNQQQPAIVTARMIDAA